MKLILCKEQVDDVFFENKNGLYGDSADLSVVFEVLDEFCAVVDLNVINVVRARILNDVGEDGDGLGDGGIPTDVVEALVDIVLLCALVPHGQHVRKDLDSVLQDFTLQSGLIRALHNDVPQQLADLLRQFAQHFARRLLVRRMVLLLLLLLVFTALLLFAVLVTLADSVH